MAGQRLDPVCYADFELARMRLKQVIQPTPLVTMEALNQAIQSRVYLKAECLMPVGSFKIRGAYNKMASLSMEERSKGVITASSGNHAISVSYASRLLNVEATVVVPQTAPFVKRNTCRSFGANVIEYGEIYDEAYLKARCLEEEEGTTYVHPVADTDVIAGQGTIGLEILEQLPSVKQVVVPLGGGGLVSGVAIAIKMLKPSVKIIAVQPEGSPVYYRSMKENHIVELSQVNTIADGLSLKRLEPFLLENIKKWVDDVILVKEKTIREAIRLHLLKGKMVVEGAGAAALAAVMEGQVNGNEETVLLSSGSNIDEKRLEEILLAEPN